MALKMRRDFFVELSRDYFQVIMVSIADVCRVVGVKDTSCTKCLYGGNDSLCGYAEECWS